MITVKQIKDYENLLDRLCLLLDSNSNLCNFNKDIEYISYNSLDVKPGTLFICKGANFKEEYLKDALKKGAIGYVADHKMNVSNVPYMVVTDLRRSISEISGFYFDYIWKDNLDIIGLTGTKGKSTTATFIKSIMDAYCDREIGFSSGIYTYDGKQKVKARKLTTPETIELHRILASCVENDCRYLTMEVSSQALKYDRTAALHFKICGFLNISEDHISEAEHRDMEDYFTSKLKIFSQSQIACVNMDMDKKYLGRVLDEAYEKCDHVVTFGFSKDASVRGIEISEKPGQLKLQVILDEELQDFIVNIGGDYNASNALAAIAVTKELGVPVEYIKKGLEIVKVAGRMEMYSLPGKHVDVIVDCAHNKMSYNALFDYVHQQYPNRKIGFLFGCVGNKAFNRRKEAGEIADANADFIIVTERDPGTEDVNKICQEIFSYIKHKDKAEIITDRDLAVKTALDKASSMDNCVLILAGCGSDAYVKRGTKFIEFATDGERVQEYLKNL